MGLPAGPLIAEICLPMRCVVLVSRGARGPLIIFFSRLRGGALMIPHQKKPPAKGEGNDRIASFCRVVG